MIDIISEIQRLQREAEEAEGNVAAARKLLEESEGVLTERRSALTAIENLLGSKPAAPAAAVAPAKIPAAPPPPSIQTRVDRWVESYPDRFRAKHVIKAVPEADANVHNYIHSLIQRGKARRIERGIYQRSATNGKA